MYEMVLFIIAAFMMRYYMWDSPVYHSGFHDGILYTRWSYLSEWLTWWDIIYEIVLFIIVAYMMGYYIWDGPVYHSGLHDGIIYTRWSCLSQWLSWLILYTRRSCLSKQLSWWDTIYEVVLFIIVAFMMGYYIWDSPVYHSGLHDGILYTRWSCLS